MRDAVIDTNVLVCANGKGPVGPADAEACAHWLVEIKNRGRIVIDDKQRILREYRNNLSASGQPGIGDEFFHPIIGEASDSKWWGWKEALKNHGVHVEFLCEDYIRQKYIEKMRTAPSKRS